jgi:hypothetical protein
MLSRSAKKALASGPKSSSRTAISSPTRYFKIDVAGSNLMDLSAAILPLLFIIEVLRIRTSLRGLPSFFSLALVRCTK